MFIFQGADPDEPLGETVIQDALKDGVVLCEYAQIIFLFYFILCSEISIHFLSLNVRNNVVPKLFVFSKIFGFCIFTACFVNRKMPVYCNVKIKRKYTFLSVNTKYISSSELKTSKFSLVLRTRENFDVFNSLDDTSIYLVFTSKK